MSSFTRVKALSPGRSVFNLSYEKKFDFDMGQLIPVCMEEMVPGDTFKVGNEIVIRFQPTVAPILHEVNAYVHYFFVPTRLIFDKWEDFITGGVDGNDTTVLPRFDWNTPGTTAADNVGPYSLYDYFGFPIINTGSNYSFPGQGSSVGTVAYNYRPLIFPWRAYSLIWNEFYRDETLQEEVDLNQPKVLNRNWTKDYFTSALPWQQRGVAPALPISGTTSAVWSSDLSAYLQNGTAAVTVGSNSLYVPSLEAGSNVLTTGQTGFGTSAYSVRGVLDREDLSSNVVDLSNATTFDVSDLRLAFQVQKWLERNARGGARYTEFLTSHFGVSPTDARLQRPEYLGGSKSPILISEVVQTSQADGSTTPIGRLAGKGITADKNFICSYTAPEFGYLVGLLSVMPKPSYQNGVDRKWLRVSKYDFYFPEFAHLSEQAVTEEEIYAQAGDTSQSGISNGSIFGYQARYNEMRMNQNQVCGSLRDLLDYWHLGRQFDSVPSLNSDFITCDADRDDMKRIFAVQNVPGLICNFANIITAIRPLPKYGEPGLIDHN